MSKWVDEKKYSELKKELDRALNEIDDLRARIQDLEDEVKRLDQCLVAAYDALVRESKQEPKINFDFGLLK